MVGVLVSFNLICLMLLCLSMFTKLKYATCVRSQQTALNLNTFYWKDAKLVSLKSKLFRNKVDNGKTQIHLSSDSSQNGLISMCTLLSAVFNIFKC